MKKLVFVSLLLLLPLVARAATYNNLAAIARDSNYLNRIQIALYAYSINTVIPEGAVTSHASRLAYALKILTNQAIIGQVALLSMTDSTIKGEANIATTPDFAIADADIDSFVSSNFTKIAALN